MYRFDSIYSFAPELCIEVINLGVKLFTLQIVLLRRSRAGPAEPRVQGGPLATTIFGRSTSGGGQILPTTLLLAHPN